LTTRICRHAAFKPMSMTKLLPLSPEARRYALWQLVCRAGVRRDWFERWTIETSPQSTVVRIAGALPVSLVFPAASSPAEIDRSVPPVRFPWMCPPEPAVAELVPEFLVPFLPATVSAGKPLFETRSNGEIHCALDLLASVLLVLARWEELGEIDLDSHGRFSAHRSHAYRHGYLERPVVDEYGLALQQALRAAVPGWSPERLPLRVKLSHDVDQTGVPFARWQVRFVAGQYRSLTKTLRQALSGIGLAMAVDLHAVLEAVSLARRFLLDTAVYWKARCPVSEFDSGYDPAHPAIRSVIDKLVHAGIEMGVHPSYFTFGRLDMLREEVDQLRKVTGASVIGGRQHYLRWKPVTWRDWEACGLAYDSTVGFADHIGFRAGTSVPYQPWLLEEGRPAALFELPLLVMDTTLTDYMQISPEEALRRVRCIVHRCALSGGVFTLLWHNTVDPKANLGRSRMLVPLLSELAGSPGWCMKHTQASPS
jgi:hypothetical protein